MADQDKKLQIKIVTDAKSAVESFFKLAKQLRDTQIQFRDARSRVVALARELSSAENPSKALRKEFENAKNTVKSLSASVERQGEALVSARQGLAGAGAGVDVKNLAREYAWLRDESARAALGVQPRNGPAYPKSAGGMTDLLRAVGLMDEAFELRAEALEILMEIDRKEALSGMANAVARAIANLTGHDGGKLRTLIDLISQAKPASLENVTRLLGIP